MTNKEAIEFLKNMIGEKSANTIGKEGFYAELMGYHVEALKLAIKSLEDMESMTVENTIDFLRSIGWLQEHDRILTEPKKGKWNDRELPDENGRVCLYPFWQRYECSICGEWSNNGNFCPNCGADMREGEDND